MEENVIQSEEKEQVKPAGDGFGTASLAFGIISFFFGLTFAIMGLVMGIISAKHQKNDKATAGIICSVIVICLNVIIWFVILAAFLAVLPELKQAMQEIAAMQ